MGAAGLAVTEVVGVVKAARAVSVAFKSARYSEQLRAAGLDPALVNAAIRHKIQSGARPVAGWQVERILINGVTVEYRAYLVFTEQVSVGAVRVIK